MTRSLRIDDLLDYDTYPLNDSSHPRYQSVVRHARAQLADDGCAAIPNLLRPTAVAVISREIIEQIGRAHV